MDFIPVCEPFLNGNELKYVSDVVKTGWISSSGSYVNEFEKAFARYCGVKYGIAVCNGTVALHLAVVAAGIKAGDEVIIPDFTMVSTAFSLCYAGAKPVFVDAEPLTWNMDTDRIEAKITPRTRAIMPVSIFGHPCDMENIWSLAKQYGLIVIEDAAESHAAEYKGRRTGNLADITAFSFFANKNLTTGEGGMVVTDNEELHRKCAYYKNVCFPLEGPRNYRHEDIGFNYRMSNLHAAIGVAQVEKADEYRDLRIRNGGLYRKYLQGVPGISLQGTRPEVVHVFWMNGVLVDQQRYGRSRDELTLHLQERGIETRLFFFGMHRQPSLLKYGCDGTGKYPVTDNLTENGFYLPSSSSLREDQILYICDTIREFQR